MFYREKETGEIIEAIQLGNLTTKEEGRAIREIANRWIAKNVKVRLNQEQPRTLLIEVGLLAVSLGEGAMIGATSKGYAVIMNDQSVFFSKYEEAYDHNPDDIQLEDESEPDIDEPCEETTIAREIEDRILKTCLRPHALNVVSAAGRVDELGRRACYMVRRAAPITTVLFKTEERHGTENIDLLLMVEDRLLAVQDSTAACDEFRNALIGVQAAIYNLRAREERNDAPRG